MQASLKRGPLLGHGVQACSQKHLQTFIWDIFVLDFQTLMQGAADDCVLERADAARFDLQVWTAAKGKVK
jgi:hypothetical protein